MGGNTEPPEVDPRKRISRRDFLKLAPVLLVGGYFGLKELVAEATRSAIGYSGVTDIFFDLTDSLDNAPLAEVNSEARPIKDILGEGINIFESKSGKIAFFNREPEYRDAKYYSEGMKKKMSSRLALSGPKEMEEDLRSLSPGDANAVLSESFLRVSQYEAIRLTGSGFYNRFRIRHPELFKENKVVDYSKYFETSLKEAQLEVQLIDRYVEDRTKAESKSISTSEIFSYFLVRNDGNVGQGIADTYVYLKFKREVDADDEWFSRNIKDEFAGKNFNKMPAGQERLNLIGKPYHSWNFLNLLRYFPVEVVRLGGLSKQLGSVIDQGVDKVIADTRTLEDLRDVDTFLLTYSKSK